MSFKHLMEALHTGPITTDSIVDFGPGVALELGQINQEPTGFPQRADSTISFVEATRTFTIAPVAASYEVWDQGIKYTIDAPISVIVPDVTGAYFLYFRAGTLICDPAPPNFEVWKDVAMVAIVQWNATMQRAVFIGEERHGLMPWEVHQYLHNTQGTRFGAGFALTYTANATGNLNSDAQVALTGGTIWDEDLAHTIVHAAAPDAPFEQRLEGTAYLPVFYRVGASGDWYFDEATAYPMKKGVAYPVYNRLNAGTWGTTEVVSGDFFSMWLVATNSLREPVVAVCGQHVSNTLSAQLEAESLEAFQYGTFPMPEFRFLYRVTFRARSTYTGFMKCRVEDVTDFRTRVTPYGNGVAVASVSQHNNLPGRDVAEAHPAGAISLTPIPGSPSTTVQEELERLAAETGASSYTFTQSSPAATWTIAHNLGLYPAVSVVDSAGTLVEGSVRYIDLNTLEITFTGGFSGHAYLN